MTAPGTRSVYLAGPYASRTQLIGYAQQLTDHGWTLTARWLNGTHKPADEWQATETERAGWASDDLEDVAAADVVIAFTSLAVGGGGHSGGRHVETGYALANGKRLLLVGDPENVFHSLPQVERVADFADALERLVGDSQ